MTLTSQPVQRREAAQPQVSEPGDVSELAGTTVVGTTAATSAGIMGAAMTDMSRRDLSAEAMLKEAVNGALTAAGLEPTRLGLILVGNALGGRLCDQGCIRGQAWLRDLDLGNVPVINVDNSCAGGSSALHLGVLASATSDRPILVAGVEKMWTGDRSATLAGVEDGLPSGYRAKLRSRLSDRIGEGGSMLMSLNAAWADQYLSERGASVKHIAAATVKARKHASLNPHAQLRKTVSLDDVLEAPTVSGVLTRPMCSSFTDGAAALVLAGPPTGVSTGLPRIIGSVGRSGNGTMDYHDRLSQVVAEAWETFGLGPRDIDVVEMHDATSAEELFALESLGFFEPGQAGPATSAGETCIGGKGLAVNPSGGLVGRGHPLGATGIAQIVELTQQLSAQAGPRQVPHARLGLAVNTGGVIEGDAGFVGIHAVQGPSPRRAA